MCGGMQPTTLIPKVAKTDWTVVGWFLLSFLGSFISASLLVAGNRLTEAWSTFAAPSATQAMPSSIPRVAVPTSAMTHGPFHPFARRPPTPLHAAADLPSATTYVSVDDGKRLLDRLTHKFFDIRSARAYDDEHLTKPARSSLSVPFTADRAAFVAGAQRAAGPSTPLLVVSNDGGAEASTAAGWLREAGYGQVLVVEGGYQ
eukprot:EG_transcript_31181